MYCPFCGAQNEDNSAFCGSCGKRIKEFAETITPEVVEPEVVTPEPVVTEPVATPEVDVDSIVIADPIEIENGPVQPAAAPEPVVAPQPVQPAVAPEPYMAPQPTVAPQPVQQPVQQPKQPKPASPAKKKSMVGGIIAISLGGFALLLIIVLVILFFKFGNDEYSPEAVAKKYYMAYSKGDWSTAYDCLDINSEDPMLSLDAYVNANEGNNYDPLFYDVYTDVRTGDNARIYVNGEEIILKNAGRKFLVFTDWKVDPIATYGIVAENVYVETYADMDLYIDGEYVAVSPQIESDYPEYQMYIIPHMFEGYHDFGVGMGDLLGGAEERYVGDYYDEWDYIGVYSIEPSAEQKDAALDQVRTDFETMIQAAMNGDSFGSVAYLASANSQENLSYVYEDLCDEFITSKQYDEYKYGYSSLDFYNVRAEYYYSDIYDGKMAVTVDLYYDYDYEYMETYDEWNPWTDRWEYYQEPYYGSSSGDWYVTYVYENGSWVIYDAGYVYI